MAEFKGIVSVEYEGDQVVAVSWWFRAVFTGVGVLSSNVLHSVSEARVASGDARAYTVY